MHSSTINQPTYFEFSQLTNESSWSCSLALIQCFLALFDSTDRFFRAEAVVIVRLNWMLAMVWARWRGKTWDIAVSLDFPGEFLAVSDKDVC
jgi:hypothetical protein